MALDWSNVVAAPMPSGVEHIAGVMPTRRSAMVVAAPMPSGVAHRDDRDELSKVAGVVAAPMPSGVEHTYPSATYRPCQRRRRSHALGR